MIQDLVVRQAISADVAPWVALMGELGYQVASQHVLASLLAMRSSATDQALVAAADGRVVGCISLHAMPLVHREGKLGRITSLVVASGQRGQGIGAALLGAGHAWFRAAGCVKFEVTSGDRREGAHRFYQRHGYARDGQRLARRHVA
ncbi:MAG: GNAT family N-acetyltransferase [Rhodanobacter sp.]